MNKDIDLLGRDGYVKELKSVIDLARKNNSSESILLYGGWGSGKTFVLNKLEKALGDDGYIVFKYDAWDRDFYDEPLVGILYAFVTQLNERLKAKNFVEGLTQEIIFGALTVFSSVISSITNKVIGIDIPKEASKAYKKYQSIQKKKEIQTSFNSLLGVEEAREQVRETISNLSKSAKVVFSLMNLIDVCQNMLLKC